jgi:hypothetical protein
VSLLDFILFHSLSLSDPGDFFENLENFTMQKVKTEGANPGTAVNARRALLPQHFVSSAIS